MSYWKLFNPRRTPQSEPADARQVPNNAGGFVYGLDPWQRLERFLILGSDAPTYYQSARALTRENAQAVLACFAEDPERTAAAIAAISDGGRAPKNDPAIFALALGAVDENPAVRAAAFGAVGKVCRTGTHLFQFVATARGLGKGWGRAMKRVVADWYDSRAVDALAYQVIKYRSREGYDHNRLLDTAHPRGDGTPARDALYSWVVGKPKDGLPLPALVTAHEAAMKATRADELVPLIREHDLPWEALPTWANADPEIWRALLPRMGLTALVRNLGNMTRLGAIAPLSREEETVAARLADAEAIRRSRLHPFAILQAHAVYGAGKGLRGAGRWDPSRVVLDALDGAFYKAFQNVEPAGKRFLIGLDVSGSMGSALMGSALTCREGSAAMALVTMATEPKTHAVGFTAEAGSQGWSRAAVLTPLPISPRQRLGDVVKSISNLPFGGTDCALPMLHALEKKIEVDVFAIYTDSETWAGSIHPVQALREYRQKTGIAAKLIVVGMTSTGFTIADPQDGGMLDVVGFDSAAPAVMADFARG